MSGWQGKMDEMRRSASGIFKRPFAPSSSSSPITRLPSAAYKLPLNAMSRPKTTTSRTASHVGRLINGFQIRLFMQDIINSSSLLSRYRLHSSSKHQWFQRLSSDLSQCNNDTRTEWYYDKNKQHRSSRGRRRSKARRRRRRRRRWPRQGWGGGRGGGKKNLDDGADGDDVSVKWLDSRLSDRLLFVPRSLQHTGTRVAKRSRRLGSLKSHLSSQL